MFQRSAIGWALATVAVGALVGCVGPAQEGAAVGPPGSASDSAVGTLLEPSESAASACTAVGVSRNQGDEVFYDGLAIASDRAATATAGDPLWLPLTQSLSNLTAIPRPTPTATQAELDNHYSAYLAVVIACLPAGIVLPTD